MIPPSPTTDLRKRLVLLASLTTLLVLSLPAQAAQAATAKIDFLRDIRPILSEKCFKCHGPDATVRKGKLRLDRREDALKAGRSGEPALVPGNPGASEAIRRILSTEPDDMMPPPRAKNPLGDRERDLLRRWVEQGAEYQVHWAFVPPRQGPLPTVKDAAWPRNPIDHFVLARLEKEGLRPSPPADPYTLVRRLYLDLIGLPPTPEEADAFVRDPRPDAYERLVDRLLASPHYGERWARRWLDLARYADTNGYEKDRVRSIWPYREWVIKALNADMPFDRFTIEQIAGDMLPNATPEQRIATGFHRNTMTNEEGGIDVEEFRFHALVDRIGTTGTVWLGLTLGCCQCHSHKYDPFSQHEYYGLFALLNNADEPEMNVPDEAVRDKRAEIEAKIAAIRADLENRFPLPAGVKSDGPELRRKHLEERLAAWQEEAAKKAGRWVPLRPGKVVSKKHATMTVLDDDSVHVSGDWPNNDTYVVEVPASPAGITALRLEVLPDPSLPEGGPGRAPLFQVGDFLLSEFQAAAVPAKGGAERPLRFVSASHSHAKKDTSAALALDGKLDSGWSILGRPGEAHRAVFVLEKPAAEPRGTKLVVTLEQQGIHQMTIGRFRLWATTDVKPAAALDMPCEVEAALAVPAEKRTAAQRRLLRQHFLQTAPELAAAHKEMAELRKGLPRYPSTLVMQERRPEHARVTYFRQRGEFLKPTEPVAPGVPEVLHPLPRDVPAKRLALARWLVDGQNPLVGRVTMNRHWQAVFGQGIVRTTEDFGTRGEAPTHPDLLDWLAVELPRRGWSVKAMHRLIVTSATYRQSSVVTPDLLRRDPQNKLLARGPRLRVEAEMVRDITLRVSGLLSAKLGGPSVFPPQPEGSNERSYGGFQWQTSTGPDRYRRGLYTFLKRTSPYAMFGLFDAPSGEACVPRRDRSNTALQALTMLNDQVVLEAARTLAASTRGDTPERRVTEMFRRCVTRRPSAEELHEIVAFYEKEREHLSAHAAEAAKLAGGDAKQDREKVVEQAAWTAVARALLNLDETITKE
jgi:hypothetical protein